MIAVSRQRAPTTLLLIAAIAALVALIYADTFGSMVAAWSYSSYRHGFIVVPVSAYLLWRLRGPLAEVGVRPWPPGIVVLLGLVSLWVVAGAAGIQVVEQLSAVLMIPAAVATCLGVAVVRRCLFPLLFLALAVPIGDELIPYLMRITADLASTLLRGIGIPVFRQGQFISLPVGDFEVADVCSGLRSLVAGTAIALLFAYLTYKSHWRRATFVAVTALCLVVVNGIRAFVVMWVASVTNMRVFGGDDHIYFGWLLFGVVMAGLFWVGARYSDETAPVPAAHLPSTSRSAALSAVVVFALLALIITAKPLQGDTHYVGLVLFPAGVLFLWGISRTFVPKAATLGAGPIGAIDRRSGAASAMIAAVTAVTLVAGPLLLHRASAASSSVAIGFDLPVTNGCETLSAWAGVWRPELRSPDFSESGSYLCRGEPVNVFLGGYSHNAQGKELVSDENRAIPKDWRRFVTADTNRFAAEDGRSVEVNEVVVEGAGADSLIWYWYATGDRTTSHPAVVKAMQALQVVTSGRSDGMLCWLQTPLRTASAAPQAERERLAMVAREIEAARTRTVESAR